MFKNNLSMYLATIFLFSVSYAAEGPDAVGHEKRKDHQLTKSTITVGCYQEACLIRGGYGIIANGLIPTIGESVALHNHPGVTVDLLPKAQKAPAGQKHYKMDFLSMKIPEKKVSYLMLEQIPTIKHDPTRGEQEIDYGFMPKFIKKSRLLLHPGKGRIIIHVTSDVIYARSEEGVRILQQMNPFILCYEPKLIREINQAIPSGHSNSNPLLSEAISFYNQKLEKAFRDSRLPDSFTAKSRQQYAFSHANQWETQQGPSEMHAGWGSVVRLYSLFEGKERMVNYLQNHWFHDITAEWLERGKHPYNTSSGFFLTGFADGVNDIVKKVTPIFNSITSFNEALILNCAGSGYLRQK
ncbi:MAG: hypothetical protein WCG04_02965 [Alphaproteobacteria bacterium]